jgi:hypothetical protein
LLGIWLQRLADIYQTPSATLAAEHERWLGDRQGHAISTAVSNFGTPQGDAS